MRGADRRRKAPIGIAVLNRTLLVQRSESRYEISPAWFFRRNITSSRFGFRIAMQSDMKSRDLNTEPAGRSSALLYVSLSLLIGIIAYAMIILPQRG
jgi:hypothetical protein